MRLAVLILIGPLLAVPAHAAAPFAFPLNEADYLKAADAAFAAADANHDGTLALDEMKTAFTGAGPVYVSPETEAQCMKMGHDLKQPPRPAPPPADKAGKDAAGEKAPPSLTRARYLEMRKGMFAHFDRNRDHVVTEAEAREADAEVRVMCGNMPRYMQQADELQKKWATHRDHPGGMDINQMMKDRQKMIDAVPGARATPPATSGAAPAR